MYINLETAKLAKEKGFNIPTLSAYINDKLFTLEPIENGYDGFDLRDPTDWNMPGWLFDNDGNGCAGCTNNYFPAYSAPTKDELKCWLETNGIYVTYFPIYNPAKFGDLVLFTYIINHSNNNYSGYDENLDKWINDKLFRIYSDKNEAYTNALIEGLKII